MRAYTCIFAAVLASSAAHPLAQTLGRPTPPDIIFTHAVIYTGEGLAVDKPRSVQAMAIAGGKLLAVGTNEEVMRLAGPKTLIRNLNIGRQVFVFPGFNDAHVHLGDAARLRMTLDLTGVKSETEMMSKVGAFAHNLPSAHWLTGGNWDHTLWPDKTLPTRREPGPGQRPAIPHFFLGSTATSPWPIPQLSRPQESPPGQRRRKAEPSISIPAASLLGYCAKEHSS